MKQKKKLVLLAKGLVEDDFFFDYNIKTVNIDVDAAKTDSEYIIEKYTMIMQQLYYNKGIHLNTILQLLCETIQIDKLLYSTLLKRINSLFSFGDFIVLSYNVDDIGIEVLNDINIGFKNFETKKSLIYFCKKHLCH